MTNQDKPGRPMALALTVILGLVIALGVVGLLIANKDGIRDLRDELRDGSGGMMA